MKNILLIYIMLISSLTIKAQEDNIFVKNYCDNFGDTLQVNEVFTKFPVSVFEDNKLISNDYSVMLGFRHSSPKTLVDDSIVAVNTVVTMYFGDNNNHVLNLGYVDSLNVNFKVNEKLFNAYLPVNEYMISLDRNNPKTQYQESYHQYIESTLYGGGIIKAYFHSNMQGKLRRYVFRINLEDNFLWGKIIGRMKYPKQE